MPSSFLSEKNFEKEEKNFLKKKKKTHTKGCIHTIMSMARPYIFRARMLEQGEKAQKPLI